MSPVSLLAELLGGSSRARVTFADLGGVRPNGEVTGALTGLLGGKPNTSIIRININPSAPFVAGYGMGGFPSDDNTNRAITLIHELGHAANFIFGPGSSDISNADAFVP